MQSDCIADYFFYVNKTQKNIIKHLQIKMSENDQTWSDILLSCLPTLSLKLACFFSPSAQKESVVYRT